MADSRNSGEHVAKPWIKMSDFSQFRWCSIDIRYKNNDASSPRQFSYLLEADVGKSPTGREICQPAGRVYEFVTARFIVLSTAMTLHRVFAPGINVTYRNDLCNRQSTNIHFLPAFWYKHPFRSFCSHFEHWRAMTEGQVEKCTLTFHRNLRGNTSFPKYRTIYKTT